MIKKILAGICFAAAFYFGAKAIREFREDYIHEDEDER